MISLAEVYIFTVFINKMEIINLSSAALSDVLWLPQRIARYTL